MLAAVPLSAISLGHLSHKEDGLWSLFAVGGGDGRWVGHNSDDDYSNVFPIFVLGDLTTLHRAPGDWLDEGAGVDWGQANLCPDD